MSKIQKGNYYRLKTKKWLEKQGYCVENSEVNKICYFGGRLVCVHKDLFGSDLIATNNKEFILIQSKTNKEDILDGVKKFKKYPFPAFIKRWVIRWELRAKAPEITEVK